MANCSSRKKGETEQEYRKRCGGYTYAFPIDLVQKEEPPKEEEPPASEPPAPEPPAPEGDVSEARHTKGNIYKGKLKVDGNPVQVEVELVGVDNRTRSYLVRVIHIDRKYLSYLPKTGIIPIPARIFDIPGGGWVKVKTQGQFEGKLNEAIKPQNIVNYYKGVCKAVGISPIPIKFGSVGRLGAATTYHTKTFEPLYITFDLGKVRDIETAVLHEITHQILLIKEKNPYNNCAKRPAKFAKIENSLIEKFTYSPLSKLLYEMPMVDKTRNEDVFPGGMADKYSLDDLAKKHGVGVDEIKSQIAKGVKVEMEHTNDKKVAFEIAKDHVFENPKYYDKLKTIENRIYELLKKKLSEDWTNKYKKSIDCNNPKGFSQKAHCAGRKARQRGEKTQSNSVK
jgi:hypothetical protein